MNQDQLNAKLSQISSKGLESSFALSEAALENAQKLAELNYAASKDALVNVQDSITQVLSAKDPKQVTDLISADLLQDAGTQAAAYQKKVTKVLRDSNKELNNVVESSIEQFQKGMQEWINTISANAPAGSDTFVSAMKTGYDSALQGFGSSAEALIHRMSDTGYRIHEHEVGPAGISAMLTPEQALARQVAGSYTDSLFLWQNPA